MNARRSSGSGRSYASADRPRGGFGRLLLWLVAAALAFRIFLFTPFTIPSESMLPGLMRGDTLIAAKWPYGYSRWSLPFDIGMGDGRLFAALPARGDVAIFRHPLDGRDYIKRVVGLPGDTVAMRGGVLIINGQPVARSAPASLLVTISPNTPCHPRAAEVARDGGRACRYISQRETLPGGVSYPVLDLGPSYQDNFAPVTVPPGHLFALGDNRDNSQDSRFPARAGGGIGLVPTGLLIARAEMVVFSTDGSADWARPWTWFTAARWHHIGDDL